MLPRWQKKSVAQCFATLPILIFGNLDYIVLIYFFTNFPLQKKLPTALNDTT